MSGDDSDRWSPSDAQPFPEAQPAPEGVNLLGTPEQATAVTDADRRRYAIGPFGQAWLWTFAVFLTAQGLYKAIVGPIIAASLPTVPGTVVDWIAVPGRALTFVPKIAYEVAGNQYTVVSGTAITTKVHAPTTVTVSYLPMDPSVSIWTSGEWWQGFFDTYLMVTLILGLILLGAAMYQSRIGRYWSPRFPASNAARSTLFIVIGVVLAAAGVAWAVSGYLLPGGAVIPPEPNVLAALVGAFGVGMLTAGMYYRRIRGGSSARRRP